MDRANHSQESEDPDITQNTLIWLSGLMEKYKKCVSRNQLTEIPKHGFPWSLGLFQIHDLAVEKKETKQKNRKKKRSLVLEINPEPYLAFI